MKTITEVCLMGSDDHAVYKDIASKTECCRSSMAHLRKVTAVGSRTARRPRRQK